MQAVQNNGSVYLHAFFAPSGLALDPSDSFYQNNTVFGKSLGELGPLLADMYRPPPLQEQSW